MDLPAIHLPFNRDVLGQDFVPAKGRTPAAEPRGRWIVLQRQGLIVPDEPEIRLPSGERPLDGAGTTSDPLWLGTWRGEELWTITLAPEAPLPHGYRRETLIPMQHPRLATDLITLAGVALQASYWRDTSGRCPRCGALTSPIASEWGRRCEGCGYEHYPHLHPAVIVLVRDGPRLLLARKPGWPANLYSLVAGFVDNGESLEGAAAREVREEVGVEVADLTYVGSQNWPFPSQLMIGFVARYVSGEVRADPGELEDARWFEAGALPVLPTPLSIARWIIDRHGTT